MLLDESLFLCSEGTRDPGVKLGVTHMHRGLVNIGYTEVGLPHVDRRLCVDKGSI
jgi:hypothetical protein